MSVCSSLLSNCLNSGSMNSGMSLTKGALIIALSTAVVSVCIKFTPEMPQGYVDLFNNAIVTTIDDKNVVN